MGYNGIKSMLGGNIMKKYFKGFIIGLLLATLLTNVAMGGTVKKTIEVIYNSVNLTVNGEKVDADNILYNGTTYVPLRAISEMLGKEVGWNQATYTASIYDKKVEEPKKEESKKEHNTSLASKQNPAKVNEKQIVTKKDYNNNLEYRIELTMIDLISGENALDILKDKDEYLITGVSKSGYLNERKWTDDEEFILAKFKLKVLETKDDKAKLFTAGSFEHVGKDNVFYDNIYNIHKPRNFDTFLHKDIYPGGEVEGWIVFKVNKNDNKVITVFDRNRTSEVWFDLRSK